MGILWNFPLKHVVRVNVSRDNTVVMTGLLRLEEN